MLESGGHWRKWLPIRVVVGCHSQSRPQHQLYVLIKRPLQSPSLSFLVWRIFWVSPTQPIQIVGVLHNFPGQNAILMDYFLHSFKQNFVKFQNWKALRAWHLSQALSSSAVPKKVLHMTPNLQPLLKLLLLKCLLDCLQ